MPALMSLDANKICLDYHLGNEIRYICRVNKNKHFAGVIWTVYFKSQVNLLTHRHRQILKCRPVLCVEFEQPVEPYISRYIITAVSGKSLKEERKLWAFEFNLKN